ncbi:adenylate/guanylate cyclase domain-containing protein [Mycolicibacterium bacteremicum]|uniref:adenylate/guanylate cyclase domain-containing protein n=1 Tax=Mycolicibacterium bacteremicum TaxID=564198 RepID=UPI0026EBB2F6|nr:adenylate/guanylate cyclase domain-containing protein [Mycolicibacterium bacteremicum]
MDAESFEERSARPGESRPSEVPRRPGPFGWLSATNHNADVVAMIRRARRSLPGDPEFGDPLSTAGEGGPRAAARAADRLLEREAVSREISLGALQVWQALTERVSGKPANREMTLVFTDLVGFSAWSLRAGDDATLRLLRRVAQVTEPPLLAQGGHIVKRMGDGAMVVFSDPATAIRAVLAALDAVNTVEVDGYTPRMRAGIHTGHPQRIGSDWLGVDVNIAARVMERATKGGLVISHTTLEALDAEQFEALGISAKRVRKQLFATRPSGVPEDLVMYWVKPSPRSTTAERVDEDAEGA